MSVMWSSGDMLWIPADIYDGLIEHARRGFPLEVCGLLGGVNSVVENAFPMVNTDSSREHFMMDPREQFEVIKVLRSRGMSVQVIYHSHPDTPARLSEEDLRLALTPGVSYLIVSLADANKPDVKSFRVEGGVAKAEPIVVTPCSGKLDSESRTSASLGV